VRKLSYNYIYNNFVYNLVCFLGEKLKYILSALLLASLLQVFFWISDSDKIISPPNADDIIESFSYSIHKDMNKKPFDDKSILYDLTLLKRFTNTIRVYSAQEGQRVLPIAKKLNMKVQLGIWINPDKDLNTKELTLAKILIEEYYLSISSVIVGNEVLLRKDLILEELIVYIKDIKQTVHQISKTYKKKYPKLLVTTAEVWNIWLDTPTLVKEVDFINMHILPYWEGLEAESVTPFIKKIYKMVTTTYKNKSIAIGEFGWPSRGYNNKDAVASPENQARIIRRFLILAKEQNFNYNIIEAFDQPWKGVHEGSVGQYWGIFDAKRHQKFELHGPVLVEPYWFIQMIIAVFIGALLTFFGLRNQRVNFYHSMIYGLAAQGTAFGVVMSAIYPFIHYMNPGMWIMWGMGSLMMIPLTVITLAKANELLKCTIGTAPERLIPIDLKSKHVPLVSIHVPAYKEQPHVLMETLVALSKLNYTNYEVLVVINNTSEDFYKDPIKTLCEELGEQFIYLDIKCTGFKAGALNEALAYMDPLTEIIAMIDADYVVEKNWLIDLVPIFDDPKVAMVQAPQDHRDGNESLIKTAMNAEYAGFFDIGMVERNEENAIVAHGTMLMVRLSAFNEVGQWNSDTIVEDSELGLRLFEAGYCAHYTNRRYGHGLLPDTIEAFKNQRHRWAYGAIQILKKHWQHFMPSSKTLTAAQKHHFITGWFFWLSDALGTVTAMLNIIWVPVILFVGVTMPTIALTVPILTAFIVNVTHAFVLYRTRVKATLFHSLLGAIAAMSLQLTIFKAVFDGFVKDGLPFKRTEKGGNAKKSSENPIKYELLLAFLLLGSCIALIVRNEHEIVEIYLFACTLFVQSIPYISAIVLRLIEISSAKKI